MRPCRPDGALISGIAPDGAAAAAGLKPGDVIIEVDGEPIQRCGNLSSRIGLAAPGDVAHLKAWRDKSPRDVTARLDRAEDGVETAAGADTDSPPGELGLRMRPLTREERTQARVDGGLAIEGVAGPTARAGVQPGDLLLVRFNDPLVLILPAGVASASTASRPAACRGCLGAAWRPAESVRQPGDAQRRGQPCRESCTRARPARRRPRRSDPHGVHGIVPGQQQRADPDLPRRCEHGVG
jgi:hypothetical protein